MVDDKGVQRRAGHEQPLTFLSVGMRRKNEDKYRTCMFVTTQRHSGSSPASNDS